MFELSPEKRAKVECLLKTLNEAADEVRAHHGELVEKIGALFSAYRDSVTGYNQVCDDLNAFLDELQDEIDDFVDKQPGTWQVGEDADAFQAWLDELSEIEFIEIDLVRLPHIPDPYLTVDQNIPLSVEAFKGE